MNHNWRPIRGKVNSRLLGFFVLSLFFCVIIFNDTFIALCLKAGSKFGVDVSLLPKIQDQLNINKTRLFSYSKNLDTFEFLFSKADLQHFDKLAAISVAEGRLLEEKNTWRNAELKINGQKYKVKVRVVGDLEDHWKDRDKSLTVKFQDNVLYLGMKRIDFKLAKDKNPNQGIYQIESFLAERVGLTLDRDSWVGLVKVNGRERGLYQLEEHLDSVYLEKREYPSAVLVAQRDTWFDDLRAYRTRTTSNANGITTFGISHNTPFIGDISNLDLSFTIPEINAAYFYREMLESPYFLEYWDREQLSSYYAAMTLFGSPHSFAGDNFRAIYDQTARQFVPVFDIDNQILMLGDNFERDIGFYLGHPKKFAVKLVQDDRFRVEKNRKLYKLVSDPSVLKSILGIIDENTGLFFHDHIITGYEIRKESQFARCAMINNFLTVQSSLEYAKLFCGVIIRDKNIEIELAVDSASAIIFDQFILNFAEEVHSDRKFRVLDQDGTILHVGRVSTAGSRSIDIASELRNMEFVAGMSNDLTLEKKTYRIIIDESRSLSFEKSSVEINARNSITARKLDSKDIHLTIADGASSFGPSRLHGSVTDAIAAGLFVEPSIDGWRLGKGKYRIKKNIIVPEDVMLIMEPGVELEIESGMSVLVYGSVRMKGTEHERIIIKNAGTGPYGSFGIVGRGNGSADLDWVDVSGGSETLLDGVFLSGGLSIYHVGMVTIKNSNIHGNHADDGLNIKACQKLAIEGCEFFENFADQVDLDFCKGTVSSCTFRSPGKDLNGDGIDFSGSMMVVTGCSFSGFEDKGMSIGEDTIALVYRNDFRENRSAITAKDHSHVYIWDNVYDNNAKQLELYQKKPMFGYPFMYNGGDEIEVLDLAGESRYYILDGEYLRGKTFGIEELDMLEGLVWIEKNR